MQWLQIAHRQADRTRLRASVLRGDRAAGERLADALAGIRGVREVRIRPYTGSALVEHTAEVTLEMLLDAARTTLGIERVLARHERAPLDGEAPPFSSIARNLVRMVRELDRDIRHHSEGTVDLGMLATFGFLGAGAAQVIQSRELPIPPWFNLAWWGFRTFMTTEGPELDAED